MKAVFGEDKKTLIENVNIANTFYSRLLGLMFSEKLEKNKGLLLNPCNSIHTCFMNYPIDIVFLDKNDYVVKIIRNMKPWRMSWIYFNARKTLELNSNSIPLD